MDTALPHLGIVNSGGLGGLKETKMCLPHPRVKLSIVESLRDREVASSASDRQGSNFESCVWRTVSFRSSHHPQEVLMAQFSRYMHKGGVKPDSFHFFVNSGDPHLTLKTVKCEVFVCQTISRVPIHTGKSGKTGKVRSCFPVRDKSGNLINLKNKGKI